MNLIQSNPKDASGIILYFKNKVLLQKRDKKKGIFYPNYWGLFGGAKNKNENYKTNIIREINEELNIQLNKNLVSYFFKLKIEFPISLKKRKFVHRYFYLYEIRNLKIFYNRSILSEGESFSFFSRRECEKLLITPYDKFALDFYFKLYK